MEGSLNMAQENSTKIRKQALVYQEKISALSSEVSLCNIVSPCCPWQPLAGLGSIGRPWQSFAVLGSPWQSQAVLGTLWHALARLGTPWYALVHLGTPWYALTGLGRPWQALAAFGCPDRIGNLCCPWQSLQLSQPLLLLRRWPPRELWQPKLPETSFKLWRINYALSGEGSSAALAAFAGFRRPWQLLAVLTALGSIGNPCSTW